MSPPLRASNEHIPIVRVPRAQGTHRAILSPAGGLFQHPERETDQETEKITSISTGAPRGNSAAPTAARA